MANHWLFWLANWHNWSDIQFAEHTETLVVFNLTKWYLLWPHVGRHFVALCACPEVTLRKCKFSVGGVWAAIAIAARVHEVSARTLSLYTYIHLHQTTPSFFPSDALCFGKYCLLTLVLQSQYLNLPSVHPCQLRRWAIFRIRSELPCILFLSLYARDTQQLIVYK